MKIAIDVVPIRTDGQVGGAMHVTIELIKKLAQMNDNDNAVKIVLLTAAWNDRAFADIFSRTTVDRVIVAPADNLAAAGGIRDKMRRLIQRLRRRPVRKGLLRRLGVDLLFCPMSAVTFYEDGIPAVSTIHDIQHEYYPQFFDPQELSHRRAFYQEICAKASAVICVSKYTKATFKEKYGFPSERMYVAYNGVQERLRLPSPEQQQAILAAKGVGGDPYLFYPANFWRHKNHLMLLTAFSAFCRKHPEIEINLVFTGALQEENAIIKDAVEQMGLTDKTRFLGYLADEEIAVIMHHCAGLIFPSLFEGFGIPLVEAMNFGKPVLCANTTSLPEVAGDAALYFDPRIPQQMEDAIFSLLTDSLTREKLSAKGRERASLFSLDNMAGQYMQAFQQVLKQTAPAASCG